MPSSREWKAEYYQRNKSAYRDRAKRRRVKYRDLIREAKDKPCADCHNRYPPYVMDFDHLHSKEFDISKEGGNAHISITKLISEMEKCEVVCANCHRERTHRRRGA